MAAPGMKDSGMIAEDTTTVKLDVPTDEEAQSLDSLAAAGAGAEDVTTDLLAKYMQIEAHDWHNRVRGAVLGLISAVPKVGGAISMLIGFFWPANKVDIWAALNAEQYVRNIVRQEIFEFEMQLHQSDIEALQTTIFRYDRAALTSEKGNFLSIWISQADALSIRLRNSTNNIHLLLHIVTVAVLHVAALHERLLYGEELYGSNNAVNWRKDLVDVFQTYTSDLVPNLFREWRQWRESQIEIRAWVVRGQWGNITTTPDVSHATVEDKKTGDRFAFRVARRNSTTIFSDVCQDHKTRMMNEAVADMASCLSPTFGFHKLLPDDIQPQYPPYNRELFGQVFRGPYSQDLMQPLFTALKTFRTRPTRFDQTARDIVLEMIIRSGHHVDAIQFWYDHANANGMTAGTMAGNSAGGSRHVVDVRNRPIQDLRLEFSQDVLASLQLHFEDGTSTRKFGNELGWASNIATCTTPGGYRLSSWAFREDPGPYGTTAISVLRFQFTPEEFTPEDP